jgi:hypothetical protein
VEYALSLRQNRLFHARAVGYDDCCELQIVCPACHEALFKRGNAFTKREYFCHYTAKLGANCELRVRAIVEKALAPTVVVPKGQDLRRFLLRFENIVIDHLGSDATAILPIIQRMRRRASFRRAIHINRITFIAGLPNAIRVLNAESPRGQEIDAMHDVCRFLLAANSFSALAFAISCGLALHLASCNSPSGYRMSGRGSHPRDVELRRGAVQTSDMGFERWAGALSEQDRASLGGCMFTALCETASLFVLAVSESFD